MLPSTQQQDEWHSGANCSIKTSHALSNEAPMSFPGRPGGRQTPGEAHWGHCLLGSRKKFWFPTLRAFKMHFLPDDPGSQRGFKVRHLMINVQSVCRPGSLCGNGEVAGVRCGTTRWYPYAALWSSFSPLQPCSSKCAPKLHPTVHTETFRLPKGHVSLGAHGERSSKAKNRVLDHW